MYLMFNKAGTRSRIETTPPHCGYAYGKAAFLQLHLTYLHGDKDFVILYFLYLSLVMTRRRLQARDYTVGWICALPIELAAAQEMLDEEDECPSQCSSDSDLYTLGRIADHNVVLACLPAGQMGPQSAAAVAARMTSKFTSIRFGLMVGIGGGVPSVAADIRLGDVVISQPYLQHGGVVQYDFGKTIAGGHQTRTGWRNAPPSMLLRAISELRALHYRGRSNLATHISAFDRLEDFSRKTTGPDVLFEASYNHTGGATCEQCSKEREVKRTPQKRQVVIHYGTIASGNQVIKDGITRDRISTELGGVMCFEMEAAGLMNDFPCLVVRGICDYADSHKNKKWQPYAAATAAACAKEILSIIPAVIDEASHSQSKEIYCEHSCYLGPVDVDVHSILTSTGSQTNNYYHPGAQAREEKEKKFLKCLKTSPYQDRKERNPDRVPGTCDWFVSHKVFLDWQESKSSRMLWVSADPGCGKSVLAKYLVDFILPTTKSRTVCYFFFKDDFEDQRNVVSALCCILHQLFRQKPLLLTDAVLRQFDIEGESFTNSLGELWNALINVAKDGNAGEIICLLDALDECEDQERSLLAQKLCQLYGTERKFNLKFLITSRPYSGIRYGFQPLDIPELPMVHLSGESEVEIEKISQEINVLIEAKVLDIGARLRLTDDEQVLLLRQLMRVPHRTYLWVHLTLDLIENDIYIEKSGIVKATSQLPQSVHEAYDKILSKSHNPKEAKRILHITLAAARPLTLSEMNVALVQKSHRSYDNLDLLDPTSEDRFRERLRNFCGLFVTIIGSRIYLLHQTAKEFLVQNDTANSPEDIHMDLEWKHSLRLQESHRIIAEICIRYLLLEDFENRPLGENGSVSQYVEDHIFLDYSAKHWAAHFRELQIEVQGAMTQSILRICEMGSRRCLTWFRIYWASTNTDFPQGFTNLMIVSYFGLSTAVKHLLKIGGVDLNSRDDTYRRSALSWAAGRGFDAVVKLLINDASIGRRVLKLLFRERAKIDSVDRYGRTPLSYAVWIGNVAVVELLIKAGARADSKDEIGGTPLSYAVCNGYREVIELLLKGETQADLEDISKELLFSAAEKGHEDVVRLLLDTGKTDLDARDNGGRTPLSLATKYRHGAIVKLLLATGKVDVDARDNGGRTPLSLATEYGHGAIVKLLLATGKVDVDARDKCGWTPLSWAIEKGRKNVVELLLKAGAKVDYSYTIDVSKPTLGLVQ
ncbi:MAG: hypothetical protein M1839_001665 [Geoglossum umbratile]|nr:MAG: hypothetical protein M1839_001665 [Geoglossum umbratile]